MARSLLYEFEQALQRTDPPRTSNVTIPYWNWTEASNGVRYPLPFEESGSVLCDKRVIHKAGWNAFHSRRNRSASSPFYTPQQINQLYTISNWADFAGIPKIDPCSRDGGGDLEHPIHDRMHGDYVGGDLQRTDRAARDPIFWSFHCYIDLIFDRWQQENGQSPTSPTSNLRGLTLKKTPADVEHTSSWNTITVACR